MHLYRPFSVEQFALALPSTARPPCWIALKSQEALASRCHLDVVAALSEAHTQGSATFAGIPRRDWRTLWAVVQGVTPAMVRAIYDELSKATPKNHFTIGINDDMTNTSLTYGDPAFSIEDSDTVRCVFWGLGSDGTVGANKNSIKIIGEESDDNFAQGYFVYDSKKSGSVTISICASARSRFTRPHLIEQANFVACHQFSFLERLDVLKSAMPGAIFLLNSAFGPEDVWAHLPVEGQRTISKKNCVSTSLMRIVWRATRAWAGASTPSCRRASSRLAERHPVTRAIAAIKQGIKKTYGKRGEAVVHQSRR